MGAVKTIRGSRKVLAESCSPPLPKSWGKDTTHPQPLPEVRGIEVSSREGKG